MACVVSLCPVLCTVWHCNCPSMLLHCAST